MTLYALQTCPTGPLLWPWKTSPGSSPPGSPPCPHLPPTAAPPAPTSTYPPVCSKGLLFFMLHLLIDSQGSLPLIWLLGILPPPESFFLWLAEQVAITSNYSSLFPGWTEQLHCSIIAPCFGFLTLITWQILAFALGGSVPCQPPLDSWF